MADEVRAGIIGTGFSGHLQARSIKLAGGTVAGVSGSSPERARQAADELRAETAYASAEDLIAADDIDVVHICAPNALHEPLAAATLAAGKHVVCEKPLAMDAAGAQRLTAAAAAAGVIATVPFVYRFHPVIREAQARVASGDLGRVYLIHGSYLQDWLLEQHDWNWRVDPAQGGASRAFADIGSHWCDLIEFVTGHRIVSVWAQVGTALEERVASQHRETFTQGEVPGTPTQVTTEDFATMMFTTDQGATGSTVISQVSAGRKNRLWFEIDAANAAIAFDQEESERLWLGERAGVRWVVRDPAGLAEGAGRYAFLPGGHAQGYADCFDAFVADTYRAIRGGASAMPVGLPTFADGLRAARITEAVLTSAASGSKVDLDDAEGAAP